MPAPVVSFDLDGVIMRGAYARGLRPRIWEHLGRGAGLAHLVGEEREREISSAVRQEHERRLAAGELVDAWDWQAIYNQVSRQFGGEPLPEIEAMVREACLVEDAIGVLPGVWSGLRRLTRAGVRIVATTNGYRMFQWPVLESLGLADFFEQVITPDLAHFAKPDPRIFGLVPGLVAHVGDLLMHDVLGANKAGLQSVWLVADLPPTLRAWPAADRPRAPEFGGYLAAAFDRSQYRQFHPEATLESCTPTAVVCDVDEAATFLIDTISATCLLALEKT